MEKKLLILFASSAIISFALGIALLHSNVFSRMNPKENKEITTITASHDLKEQRTAYLALIGRVGPEQAQELLLKSGLPFTGQTHLLNHTVGEWLFDTLGVSGILKCKEYFLASCYHGLIIKAIGLYGNSNAAERIITACKQSPSPVLAQCAHALGHGFLAWSGYANLIPALHQCDTIARDHSDVMGFPCYDGVFMENVWAIHDGGTPSPDRWIKPEDPLYPCSDPRIAKTYLPGCWSNQPALLFQLFKGDIKKVSDVCADLSNDSFKTICFDGLARQIHPLTNGNSESADHLCSLMPSEWIKPCLVSVSKAAFSVGDRQMPFEICNAFAHSKDCYATLISMIASDTHADENLQLLCAKINDSGWKQSCLGSPVKK